MSRNRRPAADADAAADADDDVMDDAGRGRFASGSVDEPVLEPPAASSSAPALAPGDRAPPADMTGAPAAGAGGADRGAVSASGSARVSEEARDASIDQNTLHTGPHGDEHSDDEGDGPEPERMPSGWQRYTSDGAGGRTAAAGAAARRANGRVCSQRVISITCTRTAPPRQARLACWRGGQG